MANMMPKFLVRQVVQYYQLRHTHRQCRSRMYQNVSSKMPSDTKLPCKSHKMMLYYDLLRQSGNPGTFHLMPLTVRSLKKLKRLISEEMYRVGGEEISMPALSGADLWKQSGRWEKASSELFKLRDRRGVEYCLGPTHEEAVCSLYAKSTSSHKIKLRLYQITKKFRDEMAPKYGLLRGREFDMKDMYTFDATEEDSMATYEEICSAYERLFERLGLRVVKVIGTTGNIGGSLSHEFHLPADIGEDTLYVCDSCHQGFNEETLIEQTQVKHRCKTAGCHGNLKSTQGIEVGHSFLLGSKYSEVFEANIHHLDDNIRPAEMGCYGLGVTRILGAALEVLSTDDQLRWPSLIAPYQIYIIPQKEGYKDDVTLSLSIDIYDKLTSFSHLHREVVLDDRVHFSIGKRLYEAKRLGYPYIVISGKKALLDKPEFEVIDVYRNSTDWMTVDRLLDRMSQVQTVTG